MKPIYWIMLSTFTPILLAQPPGDGCAAAADSLNRVREKFYANAENLDYRTAYSSMVTATRNCPDWGVLWYFRATLGLKGGATAKEREYYLDRAKKRGWNGADEPSTDGTGEPAPLPAKIATKWALVVGVGRFKDPKLRTLTYPAVDARAVRDLLVDPKVGRFPEGNVQLITNEEATVARIREEIGWLRQKTKPEDLVLVYFASHGLPRDEDPNGVSYIAVNDSTLTNAATRYATSIQMIDLVNTLTRELQALRVVLILDTCYSGDATTLGQQPIAVSQLASFSESLRLFQSGAGRVVLTAASADQLSYESAKLKHGYFTHFLLQTLKKSSGQATIGEIFKDVKANTENAVQCDLRQKQTPQMIAGSTAAGMVLGVRPDIGWILSFLVLPPEF
jgi:hypothetical protein